jgi:hypothetical protein
MRKISAKKYYNYYMNMTHYEFNQEQNNNGQINLFRSGNFYNVIGKSMYFIQTCLTEELNKKFSAYKTNVKVLQDNKLPTIGFPLNVKDFLFKSLSSETFETICVNDNHYIIKNIHHNFSMPEAIISQCPRISPHGKIGN